MINFLWRIQKTASSLILCLVLRDALAFGMPPEGIMLPWRLSAIDHEFAAAIKPKLEALRYDLAKMLFNETGSLQAFLAANSIQALPELLRLSQTTQVGSLKTKLAPYSLTFQPILCAIGDQTLLSLATIATSTKELKQLTHVALPLKNWGISADFKTQLLPTKLAQAQGALKLSITTSQALTDGLLRSADCLNLLASELALKSDFRLVNFVGNENLASLDLLLNNKQANIKANTHWFLTWATASKSFQLPITLALKRTTLAAVFADQIGSDESMAVTLNQAGNKLSLALPSDFFAELKKQDQALSSDLPIVRKIYGAWVYLDKGRAWGLKMGDRLIAKEESNHVKGHVVGFFGPEQAIKNAQGLLIAEGAIVYIRKGQRQTKLDQAFMFDDKHFPTAWPPKSL